MKPHALAPLAITGRYHHIRVTHEQQQLMYQALWNYVLINLKKLSKLVLDWRLHI